jgi:hypothetical protein
VAPDLGRRRQRLLVVGRWLGGQARARTQGGILEYQAYEYLAAVEEGVPQWSDSQFDARPFPGMRARETGSAIWHAGVERYLFFTSSDLYDAPEPWGPWTHAGSWTKDLVPEKWRGGYMPGIIPKDLGEDSFWFTISGQNDRPKVTYTLNLGRAVMNLRRKPGDSAPRSVRPS